MKNLLFNLPHIRIIGNTHCGNTRREAFKCCRTFKVVFCCRDYAGIGVASFSQQIKSAHYDRNQSVSI